MHLLRTESRSIDDVAVAVDLGQTPADIVFLSFTDSDLAAFATAWESEAAKLPSLRVASLAQLRHPYSVDRYVESVAAHARLVLVRLLGGLDYWRYGVDELAAAARVRRTLLAVVPGDHMEDARLDEASTLPENDLRRIWAYFQEGGPANMTNCLRFAAARFGPAAPWQEPERVAASGVFAPSPRLRGDGWVQGPGDVAAILRPRSAVACGTIGAHHSSPLPASGESGQIAPRALIIFYRSLLLSSDTAPITALADALSARGFRVSAVYVISLKDPAVVEAMAAHLAGDPPDVIVNTTAFSARRDEGGSVLDAADAPVFQVILGGSSAEQWQASARGLAAADLAMNVVLPEIDGRIVAGAVSFKAQEARREALQYARTVHRPEPTQLDPVAGLAAAWARLRQTPRGRRRIACVLSDYPAKGGRAGYAVGLDTPQSVMAIAAHLRDAGFDIAVPGSPAALMDALVAQPPTPVLSLRDYRRLLDTLPPVLVETIRAAWGPPAQDPALGPDGFAFRIARSGNLVIAVQPDRGRSDNRKSDYHDTALAPRHAYVAFYLWLREAERVHALIHCGTHGTLEWLPGKAVALSPACAPQAVLGSIPVIYPFIVNNPGEAAQAKRRIAAVTIGHLTPPLMRSGTHGATLELEGLFDEYAQAETLDPRRARQLAALILERAAGSGLFEDSGIAADAEPRPALAQLDAWLCDIKDMRIGDGLHVFGRPLDVERRTATLRSFDASGDAAERLDRCADAEMQALVRALDGRFVAPGPAGAPSRGRLDVLPTGRNLYTVDPRAIPTRTAWEIGRRTADEVLTRYLQDHGEWPARIVLDLWGSATMRTGGDELAQAMALIGVRPLWDSASTRVSGFEILAPASLGRPRIDATLRISGLFRDVFPAQIALFDDATRAVAALDEPNEENPLAAARRAGASAAGLSRIFGAAPGGHGVGLSAELAAGAWTTRDDLAELYLGATSHAYGRAGEATEAATDFRARVAGADAFVHVQDMAEQDVLDADAFAEHEGGFAAAAALLGNRPAIYHADTARAGAVAVRTLAQEVGRVVRARATNPRWIRGQMRHGFRGAAEIAETLDNLFAFAATTDAVPSRHFDLYFDATLGDAEVRAFLVDANPAAARGMANRFEEARARGFWHAQRNSAVDVLAEMCGAVS